MDSILIYIMGVLSVAYVVRVLLFDGSTQPFEDTTKFVQDGDENGAIAYPVGLFDHVRRLFGAYRVEDAGSGMVVWHTTVRMDLWRCPKCLSFWMSLSVSAPFVFYVGEPLLFPLIHLSMVFCVQFLLFIQLRLERD